MGKILDLEDHRGPGRVRTPARRPSPRRRAKTEQYNQELEEFVDVDVVVQATTGGSIECLYTTRDAVAQEAAALLWQRMQAVPGSREAARISSRRIAALAEVGSLTLAINRADPGQPSPERLVRVLALLRQDIEDVAMSLFDDATSSAFVRELGKRLVDDATKRSLEEVATPTREDGGPCSAK